MPTILTPQGWVKVAPPPPRKRAVNRDPAAALRGPLAYLACQRSSPKLNVGGSGNVKGRADYPYDLSASPEKLRRQGEANAHAKAERSFSAPVMHGGLHPSDDDVHGFPEPEMQFPPPRSPKSKAQSRSSPKSRTSSRHHDNDNRHSHVSASSSSSSSSRSSAASSRSSAASSVSSATSTKSYHRPAPLAGVQARPPPSMPSAEPRVPYYSMPRYDHYAMPPPMQPAPMSQPMSRGNARSLSYSWYNATTPLNL